MAEIRERNEIESQYKWNLRTMFESDETWQKKLEESDELIAQAALFRGKLDSAEGVLAFLKWQSDAARTMYNLYTYASLRQSEDTRDSKAAMMIGRVVGKLVGFESAAAYAIPEFLSNDEKTLQEIVSDPILADYRFMLEDILRSKPHTLSSEEETLLSEFGEALGAADNAATMLMDADLIFDDIKDKDGNILPLSEANYISYQESTDRVLRENAFRSFYKSFRQYIHTLAATYSGAVSNAVTQARVRHYDSSRQMKMFANNIPVSVYDNLVKTVHDNMNLMYRYVALRKKILGVDELHYYDLYAPLSSGSKKHYTYQQAQKMVVDAVRPLGEEYVKRVEKAYEEGWIDVYPNKGKTGGAYSSGTYDSNPFILMNFTGSLDSVSTLAHEMGHSQHSWLTNHNQPFHYADYSLFVAEVASTVNENLLIEQMLKDCDDPAERMALLNQYLEGFKGTVYRQTMFAEFEMKAHALKEKGEALDADSLSEIYNDLIKLYFGDELVLDEEVRYEWARIPHFYSPFYVYVYATGYTSAVALSEGILHDGQKAVDKYLEFLSMGSSAYPLDELKHGGVDLNTPEPIERALKKFESILEDAENTYERLRKETAK
ncbi:MAG: oligoendopeptidase F [Erysipelotrichaceae bacterium]|nr:oligoendopeptidase F [Erysipelotrichaceae bacterium]